MSTAARTISGETIDAPKISPDWVKTRSEPRADTVAASDGDPYAGENYVELKYRSLENLASDKFARGLGMFSIALGLAEVLAPGRLGRLIGVSDKYSKFLPLLGAREIAHGVGILKSTKPTTAVWTRVGGDVIDMAFLGAAFSDEETDRTRLAAAAAAVIGVGALDLMCANKLSSKPWSESDGNPKAPTTVGQPSARRSAGA